ncbi:bifunctional proline dehydrogenase/L-glutamate gamma-semialdehyde dehydrogenase PutA [Fretibacter rubidus]|uniref:bifunctional proline dehydrogenase/L-glutamate gamma-semialdehyde dehydrogenase PutA n=1 Tax=Fretibacter rubidus TaxID=570162 RepID=UPI00352AB372
MTWDSLDQHKFADENTAAAALYPLIAADQATQARIATDAIAIVKRARKETKRKGLMETFLEEFGLSNKEGLALMCLAESLLRVPDARTADKLIAEKIKSGEWTSHKGQSDSWLVNASTLGLMLTGKIVDVETDLPSDPSKFMKTLTAKSGAPFIRAAMMQAMRIMGEQFVVGRTISTAIKRTKDLGLKGKPALASYDMLGEGARTLADAERYYLSYERAIQTLAKTDKNIPPEAKHGISVKLSALYPKYFATHTDDSLNYLYPKLFVLAKIAANANIHLCLDAEEADRLVLSLKLLDKLAREPDLAGWTGLGLAVQAYQKRAPELIDRLIAMSAKTNTRLMIRLVKGAYWDSEIKHAQIENTPDYPVWTRKSTTDLCYLACARKLLDAGDTVFPQFATHNAHTVAAIIDMAPETAKYEFQRLHGMGEALYSVVPQIRPVRIYAPVGAHEDLLPYLVRRLLENGANTSFVHRFLDDDVPAEDVARSPFSADAPTRHHRIAKPVDIFGDRKNADGLDLSQIATQTRLEGVIRALKPVTAVPCTASKVATQPPQNFLSPVDAAKVGQATDIKPEAANDIVATAFKAYPAWNRLGGHVRADILNRLANLVEDEMEHFIALMAREAGKTMADSIAEVREAVDFCRYYANHAKDYFGDAKIMPGPAGETNTLSMMGRGVFICISPWNFPLAIYLGQIAAALAAGNTVVAKPAEQTPLTAYVCAQLIYKAGVPKEAFQMVTGDGAVGGALVAAPHVAGVVFTGSTEVAQLINANLASKPGPFPVFIAETGGLNGMFVDTTALKEQIVDDVISSAFNAAGQRCSALRVLFLPEQTADDIVKTLKGAMDMLTIGDPGKISTDIGPVIDHAALGMLQDYIGTLPKSLRIIHQADVPDGYEGGTFMPPTLIQADNLNDINHEVFGPVLHVVRYKDKDLPRLMAEFASKGYGLTLGIHSRLEGFARRVQAAVPAGNIYINRNIIGAVVGVQPFGGRGLSGTGPKAGGPLYVARFGTEVTISNNITAQGGDPALLNLAD